MLTGTPFVVYTQGKWVTSDYRKIKVLNANNIFSVWVSLVYPVVRTAYLLDNNIFRYLTRSLRPSQIGAFLGIASAVMIVSGRRSASLVKISTG